MLDRLQRGFWPSFYEPFRQLTERVSEWLSPASEASSNDEAYTIRIELPGVEEKDVDISVENGLLTVKGEKRFEREDKGDTWYFSERQYGAFARSFRLPDDVDEDAIKATMKDGVLTITVPRRAPQVEEGGKRIQISRG
ncbi:MAG: Hsp20/alpha crystallin family protein [Alphaproteobacteria bacterium]|nr:MAG: Hsp20/alpha crystallin family protein [Alphaproteobacteria bacterium]